MSEATEKDVRAHEQELQVGSMDDAVSAVRKSKRRGGRPSFIVMLSIAWLVLIALVGLAGSYIAPDYQAIDLTERFARPAIFGGGSPHILGSDELGRDVFSRLSMSVRLSLTIAVCSTFISAFIGIIIGFLSAHFRGWVEGLFSTIIDVQASLPFMFIALAVVAFVGDSLLLFTILMGFYGWERIARIVRGLAISAQEHGYASAVRDLGASPFRIYVRHILPNIASTVIVAMTLNFPEVILMESGLSFLGLGVQPPLSSLGNMVGYGRTYLQTAPWILMTPSLTIVLTTLSISTFGDWLRDRLDPTIQ